VNENIQKLMKQAFTGCQGEQFDPEKFAQLIVQECGQWIVDNAGAMEHLGPEYFAQAMIKEHFGVEP
jgi:hypothetical protein